MLDGTDLPDVIGIIGSRGPDTEKGRVGWTDSVLVMRLMARIIEVRPNATVVSGGAPSGVDYMVRNCAALLHFCNGEHIRQDPTTVDCRLPHFYEFLAEWRGKDGRGEFNRRAGFERNDKLVRHCGLVLALLAPGEWTPGTSDVIRRCRDYDIPVMIYHEGVWR